MKHLQLHLGQLGVGNGPHHVEEFRLAADLLEMGLTEGVLQDHIEDCLCHRILIVNKFLIQERLGFRTFIDYNSAWFALI